MTRQHPAVGIDLGTTYSAVSYLDATGRAETIRSAEGGLTTPSVIFFDRTQTIVGLEAIEAGIEEPDRLVMFAKRDVGEQQFRKLICGKSFPPEVLQALVLRKLKADAELKLGPIEKAVVTVPAFFNEPCRKATQDAGWLAGLEVLDIINEPTAAAICYGVEQGFLSAEGESERDERVLVYDLGGGTFDVTVMEIKQRKYTTIATNGDVYLGGIDWDRRIVDYIAEAFLDEHGEDPRKDPHSDLELLRKANQAKHSLTQRDSVNLQFAHDGKRIRKDLDQKTFESISEDLLERTLMTVGMVLDEAAIGWSDLTRLILVGGSTRMPMIREALSKLSGLELDRSLSPDEAVSHGAAIYAGILLGHGSKSFSGVSVSNVNSHHLGVLAVDPATGKPRRQVMIPRNTSLPARKQIRFRTHSAGQQNVKVQVVEGGDDKGTNATMIGKCVVNNLPPNTPKGTFVDVQFDYGRDGRLAVSAKLPSLNVVAEMTMDRAAGMSPETLQTWKERIDAGFSEESLALLPEAEVVEQEQTPEPVESQLAANTPIVVVPAVAPISKKPVEVPPKKSAPAASNKKSLPDKIEINIGDAPQVPVVAPISTTPVEVPPKKSAPAASNKKSPPVKIEINIGDALQAPVVAPISTTPVEVPPKKSAPAASNKKSLPDKIEINIGAHAPQAGAAPKQAEPVKELDPALGDFLGAKASPVSEVGLPAINISVAPNKSKKPNKKG